MLNGLEKGFALIGVGHRKIELFVASNEDAFSAVLFTFQESP